LCLRRFHAFRVIEISSSAWQTHVHKESGRIPVSDLIKVQPSWTRRGRKLQTSVWADLEKEVKKDALNRRIALGTEWWHTRSTFRTGVAEIELGQRGTVLMASTSDENGLDWIERYDLKTQTTCQCCTPQKLSSDSTSTPLRPPSSSIPVAGMPCVLTKLCMV
jgi:hypothetical protein